MPPAVASINAVKVRECQDSGMSPSECRWPIAFGAYGSDLGNVIGAENRFMNRNLVVARFGTAGMFKDSVMT